MQNQKSKFQSSNRNQQQRLLETLSIQYLLDPMLNCKNQQKKPELLLKVLTQDQEVLTLTDGWSTITGKILCEQIQMKNIRYPFQNDFINIKKWEFLTYLNENQHDCDQIQIQFNIEDIMVIPAGHQSTFGFPNIKYEDIHSKDVSVADKVKRLFNRHTKYLLQHSLKDYVHINSSNIHHYLQQFSEVYDANIKNFELLNQLDSKQNMSPNKLFHLQMQQSQQENQNVQEDKMRSDMASSKQQNSIQSFNPKLQEPSSWWQELTLKPKKIKLKDIESNNEADDIELNKEVNVIYDTQMNKIADEKLENQNQSNINTIITNKTQIHPITGCATGVITYNGIFKNEILTEYMKDDLQRFNNSQLDEKKMSNSINIIYELVDRDMSQDQLQNHIKTHRLTTPPKKVTYIDLIQASKQAQLQEGRYSSQKKLKAERKLKIMQLKFQEESHYKKQLDQAIKSCL